MVYKTFLAGNFWVVFLLLVFSMKLGAQPAKTDESATPFTEKQVAMLDLMVKQKPKYVRHGEALSRLSAEVLQISELLKSQRGAQQYRDSGQKAVNRIRKNTDRIQAQIQDLYFEWVRYEREIMAVYTRYGELKAVDKHDANLRSFVVQHREFILELESLKQKLKDIYNECEYLLTTKLN
jgi:hypothetical protein